MLFGVPPLAAVAQAMKWYDPDKLGASRMAIGNAIRLMCRAAKSRAGCHFAAAIGLRAELTADDPYEDEAYRLWALKQTARRDL